MSPARIRDTKHDGKVYVPEVSPQVNNLPSPKPNEHTYRPKRKPLHPLICALIGITQLLLTRTQVLHLRHNLRDRLFHAAEVSLDGLQLLRDGVAGPVAGVGPDVDVELDGAGGVLDAAW